MGETEQLCRDALLRILRSLYSSGDHLLSSFMYGPPGAPHWQRRFGAEVYVRDDQYIEALLFLRQHGASFLRDISIGSLRSRVTSFVTENYAYIAEGRLLSPPGASLADQVSEPGLAAMAEALRHSALFHPKNDVTLYPLTPVKIVDPFVSESFAFASPNDLASTLQEFGIRVRALLPGQFPPMADMVGKAIPTSAWLCIGAPDPLIARKRASAILGALALAIIRRERYLQTGRSVHSGYCTISEAGFSCTPGAQPVTPRIPSNVAITAADHPWLGVLNSILLETQPVQKSWVRALEYFYRAWFDDPRERFPTLCMALDSLVAVQSGHTKAAIELVTSTIDEPIDQDRLRLLLKLRGAVIHGAAPDVYESEHYERYYSAYGEDPICDLELIVARCLRQAIFKGTFVVQPDPHAEVVKQAQAIGRLPKNLRGNAIISDD